MSIDTHPITLEGTFVRLEPLSLSHLDGLAAIGLDPDLWTLSTTVVRSLEEMAAYIRQALQLQNSGSALPFATIHRSTGTAVGSTRFGNIDQANRHVEIGWTWIARPWQRTAVNSEAKYLMLKHAFENWGCLRVEFKTDVLNEKSRSALRRLGAVEEGVLRRHMVTSSGRVRDSVYYSIVEDEWGKVKRQLEARLSEGPAAGHAIAP
jgi:RimJ/RimL family protein N-acetyltransferase